MATKTELTDAQAQALLATAATDSGAVPRGYWQDASGNLVPIAKVKDIDKERHHLVGSLAKKAKDMAQALRQFKLDTMSDVAAFVSLSADQYGLQLGGEKGNVTLVSFDGKYKVVRAISESLAFDERLQVAKGIIDECVHLWAKGANKNIQALVNHAFQVDKAGKVSTGRVLGLRQLKIEDPKWAQAMEAIADSMKATGSKAYIRFYERDEATGEYVAIPLDVSAA